MNSKQRKKLSELSMKIQGMKMQIQDEFIPELENMANDENKKLDNMPESLTGSDMYANIEDAAQDLEAITMSLDDACLTIDDVVDYLDTLIKG